MRTIVPALAVLALLGCVETGVRSLRTFESPCTRNEDCDSGLCLVLPEYSMCTQSCSGSCPRGYRCIAGQNLCFPDAAAPECRGADLPCGSAFAPCCPGLVCASLPDVPWLCSRTCSADSDCASDCCLLASDGSTGACAPPHECL